MPRKKPKLEVKLLDERAKKPSQAPGRPVGIDLYSNEDVRIAGRGVKAIGTGIAIAIEEGYYGVIKERSGMSVNTPLGIKAGVIDSDYRGEIKVVMQNVSDYPEDIEKGDKFAQLIIRRQEDVNMQIVDEFTEEETERGEKGFGSSD
jgi:dUTP pyrophosphatase